MPAATPCLPAATPTAIPATAYIPAFLPAASTLGTHRMAIWRQRGKEIGPKRQKAGRVDTWNAQNGDLPSTRQTPLRRSQTPQYHRRPPKYHRPTSEALPFPSKYHRPAWQKSYFSTTFSAKTEKIRQESAKTSLSFSRLLNAGAGFTMFGT